MVVGTKVRVPAAGWYDDREDHGAVLHGVVVAVEEMKDHSELAVPSGVAGERVVQVNFTHKEAHVQVEEKEGQTVRREVGERATTNCERWMAASEAALYEWTERGGETRSRERHQAAERRLRGEQMVATGGASMVLVQPFFADATEEEGRAELEASGAVYSDNVERRAVSSESSNDDSIGGSSGDVSSRWANTAHRSGAPTS
jgi:hypothetical protein